MSVLEDSCIHPSRDGQNLNLFTLTSRASGGKRNGETLSAAGEMKISHLLSQRLFQLLSSQLPLKECQRSFYIYKTMTPPVPERLGVIFFP